MACEFATYKLGEICDFQNGFAFKSTDYTEQGDATYEVFRMGYIERGGGYKEDEKPVFVPRRYPRRLDKFRLDIGDIAIAMTDMKNSMALLGYTARVPVGDRFVLNQRVGRIRVKRTDIADQRFLFYYSNLPEHIDFLRSRANSGVQVNLSTEAITEAEVALPPLPEQRAIARILGTLDDKIELNRRMNDTLEGMARVLFKSWFVDFDPVRAKAEGRDLGLPKPLVDLFPARLVDSELGEIPEGWELGRVGNAGNVICGKTPPTQVSEYYGDDVPFITIPDMHGKIFAIATQKRLSHAGAASQQKKVLPAGAICVSCIATPGLVVITSELAQTNQQINTVVPSRSNETYFLFWALRSLGDKIRAGGSGGSVLTNLSTGRFAELNVLSPPSGIRSSYHLLVAPAFGRILESERESRTLATLRDTLLPKLISGEIRLKEAEKTVEAVT